MSLLTGLFLHNKIVDLIGDIQCHSTLDTADTASGYKYQLAKNVLKEITEIYSNIQIIFNLVKLANKD
jgi:hypothetical protein